MQNFSTVTPSPRAPVIFGAPRFPPKYHAACAMLSNTALIRDVCYSGKIEEKHI